MKDILETLREKNPGLRLFSVLDPEFAPYGRILPAPCLPELRAAVDAGLVSSAEAARARADADALEARLRAGFPALCALLGRVRAERIPELCAPQTRF